MVSNTQKAVLITLCRNLLTHYPKYLLPENLYMALKICVTEQAHYSLVFHLWQCTPITLCLCILSAEHTQSCW